MYSPNPEIQHWLVSFLAAHGGVAGTVHVQRGEDLYLVAAQNIPPPVIAAVVHVPRGKGMAGVAQVDKRPTQTCNLQSDETGRIKPGAKAVAAQAAIALPVLSPTGEVQLIVGIAFAGEGEIAKDREAALMAAAALCPLPTPTKVEA